MEHPPDCEPDREQLGLAVARAITIPTKAITPANMITKFRANTLHRSFMAFPPFADRVPSRSVVSLETLTLIIVRSIQAMNKRKAP